MREQDWNYKLYKKAEKNFKRAQKRFEKQQKFEEKMKNDNLRSKMNAMFRIWGFGGWCLFLMILLPWIYYVIADKGDLTLFLPSFLRNLF